MLLHNYKDGPKPKNCITICQLPDYIDKKRPPAKREPFRTISEHPFVHSVDAVLPVQHGQSDWIQTLEDIATLKYCKVHMKLGEIVQGDFFNDYIKTGNILMLSEGRPGLDNIYSLREGVLRLEIDKPTFERMGLDGKPIPSEGRKHVKARYAVEVNLRLPSMVRGKKGFERVLWAFKNVLIESKSWLFHDYRSPTDFSGPVSAFAPLHRIAAPSIDELHNVKTPSMLLDAPDEDHDIRTDLMEWLSLVFLDSPRIKADDSIDSFLSRYRVPLGGFGKESVTDEHTGELIRIRWHGLLHPDFINSVLLVLLKASADSWFALSANTFDGKAYTILKTEERVQISQFVD